MFPVNKLFSFAGVRVTNVWCDLSAECYEKVKNVNKFAQRVQSVPFPRGTELDLWSRTAPAPASARGTLVWFFMLFRETMHPEECSVHQGIIQHS